MTAAQRKTIFGKSKGLGMNSEELHVLVAGLTGCQSLTELTDKQAEAVICEMDARGSRSAPPEKRRPKADRPEVAGMITAKQKKHAFKLLFKLIEYDETPSNISSGARMAGIIRKELGITAYEGKYLWEWVNAESARKLIEILKGYVLSAERKARRKSNA